MVALAAVALPAGIAAAETLTVAQQPVADEKAVFATVESISVVPARGRIGGTVVQLNVREGDRVTAGQAIATIGDEKLGPADEIAGRADRGAAGAGEPGADRLYAHRGTGRARHAAARQARRGAHRARTSRITACVAKTAERAVVNQQLSEGQVLAPSDGRVLKKLVTVGSVVLPGDAIVTVAQQNFKLRLRVPERHARVAQSRRQDSR